MKTAPDINEALNVLTRHGIEWRDVPKTYYGRRMELYQNGVRRGDLLLTPSALHFNYETPIETATGDTSYILTSVEEGGFFDRLPERFSQPSAFSVYYARKHYHMLKGLEREEIPPKRVKTEMHADKDHVVVTHNMGSLDAINRVCMEVDAEVARHFSQAKPHERLENVYVCIPGDGEQSFNAVPRLPQGYDAFDRLDLVFNFIYPRTLQNSRVPHFKEKYLPHLNDIPLPADCCWSLKNLFSIDTEWEIAWNGREHPMERTVRVSSWGNPVPVSDRIEGDINAVNALLASMKPVS